MLQLCGSHSNIFHIFLPILEMLSRSVKSLYLCSSSLNIPTQTNLLLVFLFCFFFAASDILTVLSLEDFNNSGCPKHVATTHCAVSAATGSHYMWHRRSLYNHEECHMFCKVKTSATAPRPCECAPLHLQYLRPCPSVWT